MIATLIWLLSLFSPHAATASTFDVPSRDPFNSGGLACLGGRAMKSSDRGVANWHLPCRTRLHVCAPRTGKCVDVRVVDRGPRRSWRERPNDLDLTAQSAEDLGANGWEPVVWTTIQEVLK